MDVLFSSSIARMIRIHFSSSVLPILIPDTSRESKNRRKPTTRASNVHHEHENEHEHSFATNTTCLLMRLPMRSGLVQNLRLPPRPSSQFGWGRPACLVAHRARQQVSLCGQHGRPHRSLSTLNTSVIEPPQTWIDRFPPKTRPYLHLIRADKPIGTSLLYIPCAWSITMASFHLDVPFTTSLQYLGLFGIGAVVMRGAGCTINDMWDRKLDVSVERTKSRPLARGDITPRQALGFLGVQLSAGLAVLTQLNWYSICLGASSLSLVTIYPFMKRVTYWPQAVLGLAFNWGSLLGWSAVAGATDWSICLPLYAGSFCWTLVYDTIYAHQDKADDVLVGIRSTAILFGENTRLILSGLSASSLSLITLAGYLNSQTIGFYAGIGLATLQLIRVLRTTNFNDRPSCWKGFVGCGWAGFWIWTGLLVDYLLLVANIDIPALL